MQTVLIWDCCGEEPIRFAVFEGDLRRFDHIYLNAAGDDEELQDELNEALYDQESGKYLVDWLSEFPVDAVKNGAFVIVAGFYP
jgi:hypothetical protein